MAARLPVVDETGKVLDTTVVYPTFGEKQKQDAIAKLSQLIKKDNVRHLAIGNRHGLARNGGHGRRDDP